MDLIKLKAFRAPDEPALCQEFLQEHTQVLADFGIPQTVAPDISWTSDPHCFVIVALHKDLGMVGGIRLQLDKPGKPLPMEHTIEKMDPRIKRELAALRDHGNGEVCGLWNANRYANKGVPILLSLAVTAIATQAEAQRMVCFVAHYTKKHPSRNGFVTMTRSVIRAALTTLSHGSSRSPWSIRIRSYYPMQPLSKGNRSTASVFAHNKPGSSAHLEQNCWSITTCSWVSMPLT